jgi:hypothetical protein
MDLDSAHALYAPTRIYHKCPSAWRERATPRSVRGTAGGDGAPPARGSAVDAARLWRRRGLTATPGRRGDNLGDVDPKNFAHAPADCLESAVDSVPCPREVLDERMLADPDWGIPNGLDHILSDRAVPLGFEIGTDRSPAPRSRGWRSPPRFNAAPGQIRPARAQAGRHCWRRCRGKPPG